MKKILFIVVPFITILNTGFGSYEACPDKPEKLSPCTCLNLAYGILVKCADFNSSQALVRVFRNLHDYTVENLLLHNLILKDVLPEHLFDGLDIKEIGIEKSNLTFSQPAFKGLGESLTRLNIRQNSAIKFSGNFAIAKLKNLTELNIKQNNLCTVKNDWLRGKIPNVVKILLEDNEISQIESKAFADSPFLEKFSINGNRIKEFKRSVFPMPAKYLIEMDLSNNEIQSLPEDFFLEMNSLKKVVLSGNDLTTLPEITWGVVWNQLKSVVLLDNNLICDTSLTWIAKKWPEQVDAICVAPSALIGKELRTVYDID